MRYETILKRHGRITRPLTLPAPNVGGSCEWCGAPFTSRPRKRFCSAHCRVLAGTARRAGRVAERRTHCLQCGAPLYYAEGSRLPTRRLFCDWDICGQRYRYRLLAANRLSNCLYCGKALEYDPDLTRLPPLRKFCNANLCAQRYRRDAAYDAATRGSIKAA